MHNFEFITILSIIGILFCVELAVTTGILEKLKTKRERRERRVKMAVFLLVYLGLLYIGSMYVQNYLPDVRVALLTTGYFGTMAFVGIYCWASLYFRKTNL